ncbi:hypothetical protein RND71_019078 [Anisodus tanguticus]|uniref:Uncharacterized protein n=1 Tax=Anisodus tanguticus TaxID=243964 RepID=A0AAE1S093_9SOLA|nr:hypothetical protein RND71_019078 [Anisodus tanguticus]
MALKRATHTRRRGKCRAPMRGIGLKFPNRTWRLTATLGSPRRRREPREELSFSRLTARPPRKRPPGGRVRGRPEEHRTSRGVRCAPAALENPEDRVPPRPAVLITASGLQGEQPLGRWNNVGKGSRQNGSVTSGKGLARGPGPGSPSRTPLGGGGPLARAAPRRAGRRVPAGDGPGTAPPSGPSRRRTARSNRYGQGESDRLIKTKHCDGPDGCLRNVISRLLECQSEEIQPSAVNGGSNYDSLKVAKCLVI